MTEEDALLQFGVTHYLYLRFYRTNLYLINSHWVSLFTHEDEKNHWVLISCDQDNYSHQQQPMSVSDLSLSEMFVLSTRLQDSSLKDTQQKGSGVVQISCLGSFCVVWLDSLWRRNIFSLKCTQVSYLLCYLISSSHKLLLKLLFSETSGVTV